MFEARYFSPKMMIMAFATSLLLVLGWLSAGTTFALDPAGAYNAKPLINGKWYKIEPGKTQWHIVDYKVRRKEVDRDDDDDEKEYEIERPRVTLWMNTVPSSDNINFSIWSPDRLLRLRDEKGDDVEAPPLGRGSANENTPGDYSWTGEYHENAPIYVVVENKSHHETKYYSLNRE